MESKGFGKPLLEGLRTEESHETSEPPIPSCVIWNKQFRKISECLRAKSLESDCLDLNLTFGAYDT